ncbi:DUF5597 domain-containing protein [Microbacterium sp. SS28]|uniref:DUF5597 domain-containing protein n=1 Tax=Microbacterium sp. SS28 TaxID=2919948 RepID=UPI001FAA5EBF|nr:DUF5597 domain-containing protein [Microbacterium sp. SS28]
MSAPRWRLDAGRLLFDDEPALLLGGQVHNSTSSSPASITSSFGRTRDLGANTVIAPVCWDLSEPEEGVFDFALVDTLLTEADHAGLRLVLLWFGAFKNAASTYAPRWVRADAARFPRAVVGAHDRAPFTYEGATHKPVLSVFSPSLREADGRAFERFVQFVAEHPLRDRVALIQVENEVGLLADSRDRSAIAEAAWAGSVPAELVAFVERTAADSIAKRLWEAQGAPRAGTWRELFGDDWQADEVFMAWAFSTYVESLAARAARIWPVPLFANAWLGPQPGQDRAGQYPSGGPAARVLDVWRAGAPSLDMLSPDIYVDEAAPVVDAYSASGATLFVPECRVRVADIATSLAAGAVGWSAFGVEDIRVGSQVSQLLGQLVQLESSLPQAQRDGRLEAIVLGEGVESARVVIGDLEVVARGTRALFTRMLLDAGVGHPVTPPPPPAETDADAAVASPHDTRPFGLIVDEGDDTFLVFGQGLTLDFFRDGTVVEYDSVGEGRFVDGTWVAGRSLNGDERLRVLPLDEVGAVRIRLVTVSGVTA